MSNLEIVIEPRIAKISETLSVKRILPFKQKRMVGPFCFLDHMGPHQMLPNDNSDVGPHPHIGLSTLTYLFEGRSLHRDSVGSVQEIKAHDVNWMTAGNGVVHSERTPEDWRKDLTFHGLQAWVALPKDLEDIEPDFSHYPSDTIPNIKLENTIIRVVAGSFLGLTSPVKVHSELVYVDIEMKDNSNFSFNTNQNELGLYIVSGKVKFEDKEYSDNLMLVFKTGSEINIESIGDVRAVIVGGKAFPEPRYLYWNFVSTSKEKLELAKEKWRKQNFPKIEGETEFVIMPEY